MTTHNEIYFQDDKLSKPDALTAMGRSFFSYRKDKLGRTFFVFKSSPVIASKYSGADLRKIRKDKGVGNPRHIQSRSGQ